MLEDNILFKAKSDFYNVFVLVISKKSHLYYVLETYTSVSTHDRQNKSQQLTNQMVDKFPYNFVLTN